MNRNEKLYNMKFKDLYPLYIAKVERKDKTESEVVDLIKWLTGYETLEDVLNSDISVRDFFQKAPNLNENREKITGSICGVKIQEIEDPLMKEIRYLDKIIDELAKGKDINKIKRV